MTNNCSNSRKLQMNCKGKNVSRQEPLVSALLIPFFHRFGASEIPKCFLEALAVNNGGTRFIIFLFENPHLLEGGQ